MLKPVAVLYEDDSLVAFDKPAGLLVIPSPRGEKNTLTELVNQQYSGRDFRLHPCHRLDRDTSGVILFAKGKKAQALMMEEFRKNAVKKKYLAFVRGNLPRASGSIDQPVQDYHDRQFRPSSRQGQSRPRSQSALTHYRVVEERPGFSVVEVVPVTGRTNQIRIHFSQIGHPLLGERLYALGRDIPVKFRRLALHAAELRWRHPVDGKNICVTSDLAADMRAFLEK